MVLNSLNAAAVPDYEGRSVRVLYLTPDAAKVHGLLDGVFTISLDDTGVRDIVLKKGWFIIVRNNGSRRWVNSAFVPGLTWFEEQDLS